MADDAVALAVRLEARFDKLERDLRRVGVLAETAVRDAEDKFSKFNPSVSTSVLQGIFQGIGQELVRSLDKLVKRIVDANQEIAGFGDTARKIGVDVEKLQEVRFGIGQRTSQDTKAILKDLTDMAKLLNEARSEENSLTKIIEANNLKYKDQKGQVIGVVEALRIAAELIRNAKTELDKEKIASAFGLSKEIIPALEQGADAFDAMAARARAAGVIIDRETVQKAQEFRDRWNAALDEWGLKGTAVLGRFLDLFDAILEKMAPFLRFIGLSVDLFAALAKEAAGITVSMEEWEKIGKRAGQIFTGDPDAPQPRTRITVRPNRPATVIPKDDKSGGETKDAFDRATESINKRTAALLADTAAVGLAAGAQEQFRAELKLLEAAQREDTDITDAQITKYAELRRSMDATQALQRSGIELTDEQNKKFLESTTRIGQAAAALNAQRNAFQGVNDALRFGGNQLVDVIEAATDRTKDFGQVMQQVLRSVTRELLRAAITGEGAFAKILGLSSSVPGGVGGLLGIFSGLGKGGAGGGGSFTFSDFGAGTRNLQLGGHVGPGEWAIAGEHGPEPVFGGRTGLTVQPKMPGGAMTFAPTTIVDARGSTLTEAQVRSIVARGNAATVRAINENFGGRTAKLATYGT